MSAHQKFRVAVVTVWEVDAVDRSDAFRKAEGAVEYVVRGMAQTPCDTRSDPLVRWRRYGDLHEATLISPPLEVDTAFASGMIRVQAGDTP